VVRRKRWPLSRHPIPCGTRVARRRGAAQLHNAGVRSRCFSEIPLFSGAQRARSVTTGDCSSGLRETKTIVNSTSGRSRRGVHLRGWRRRRRLTLPHPMPVALVTSSQRGGGGGVFVRFPDLKVAYEEGQIGGSVHLERADGCGRDKPRLGGWPHRAREPVVVLQGSRMGMVFD